MTDPVKVLSLNAKGATLALAWPLMRRYGYPVLDRSNMGDRRSPGSEHGSRPAR